MTIVGRYLELGLRLNRHVDGYVDAYYGPRELRARVDSEPAAEPAALVDDADALLADVRTDGAIDDEQRRRWLEAQVVAMHAVARRLAGEPLTYVDEVELTYGVRPEAVAEDELVAAHRGLAEALGGDGDLAARYHAWLEAHTVPRDSILPAMESLAADLRERASELVGLPPGEEVEWELVSERPWAAFNYYLGGRRSRIAVNTDVPLQAALAADYVAHEAYPGHHTEHAWKEAALVEERGYGEQTMVLAGAPESVVSEGIASVAADVMLGDELHAVAAEHLRPLGVDYEPETVARVVEARKAFTGISRTAALMIHQDGVPVEEAHAFVTRWSLLPKDRVDKTIQFVTDPTWRAYISCYTEGERLVERFLDGDVSRFRRLLTGQLLPADLAAAAPRP